MFWSLLQNVGAKFLTFIVTIILARLLTPKIFGLVGMLMIFIQVSQALVIGGFNQALIQKKNPDEEDYSSVFWINLTVSTLIYLLLYFGSPWIADFYDQPVLTTLTRVFALVFVINAFSYVQEARLTKEMRFKTLTIISIPSTIIGGGVSIVMAFLDYGVWSLIALQVVTRLAYTIQLWIYAKWKPLLLFNRKKAKGLFSFGGMMMLSSLIATIYQNIYLVIIGRFFPVTSVGYYQNASNLVQVPSATLSGALNKVAFPVFSSIQDNNQRLKEGYKKIIQQVLFWVCPAFVFAGVLAEPLFHFVFGQKWLPAVPYFQILCIVGVFFPLQLYNINIIKVKGHSNLFFRLAVFRYLFMTAGIIVFIPYGIIALLYFQSLSSFVTYFINSYYSGRFIQYGVWEQIRDILPIVGLSLGIGVIVFFLNRLLGQFPDIVCLVAGFGIGAGLYWLIARYLRLCAYTDFVEIVKVRLLKKQNLN